MKKLSLLLVALAVTVSASAGVSLKNNRVVKSNRIMPKTEMKSTIKVNKLKATPRFGVITEQPEGELKSYNRAGSCLYASGSSFYYGEMSNRLDVVFAEGGKVYFKNILYNMGNFFGDSWVEGQLNEDGNAITVPMGQSVYYSESYQADVVLAWGSTTVAYNEAGNAYLEYVPDETVTEVVYTIDGETMYGPVGEAPVEDENNTYWRFEGTGLSCYWTDDNSFGGFMEWGTVLTETAPVVTPTVISEQPEGEMKTYTRASYCIYNSWLGIGMSETDGKINLVFGEDGKVYMQNPLWWNDSYNTWVEGTYDEETGIITIPTGQYLSWNEYYEYGIQLVWGSSYAYQDGYDDEGNPAYYLDAEIDDRTTEIQFLLDGNNIYLLGSEGDVYAEFPDNYNATGMMGIWSDDLSWTSLEFAQRDENGEELPFGKELNLVPAVPANPTADEWYDCGDESGYSRFYYTLPTEDVDGNPIDQEYLSYSIWVDNGNGPELFTFPASDYTFDLEYDMTEIPYWLWSSAVDFHSYYTYFYRTNIGENGEEPMWTVNIGIQVFYTVNGVTNASDIVWLLPSSVNELNEGKTVSNVRYFNVAGQEMVQPSGLTIQVTTYTDGSKSAVKVVK